MSKFKLTERIWYPETRTLHEGENYNRHYEVYYKIGYVTVITELICGGVMYSILTSQNETLLFPERQLTEI